MVGKLDPDALSARVRPERRRAARRRRSCARSSRRSPPTSPRDRASRARRRRSPTASCRSPSRTWRTRSSTSRCERGYDVTEYTLCCFGGAGGQHACLVADALGMTRVFIHPLAGVLSAYGMGLADVRALRQQAVEARAVATRRSRAASATFAALEARGARRGRGAGHRRRRASRAGARCTSSTTAPTRRSRSRVAATSRRSSPSSSGATAQQYGFLMPGKALVIEAVAVEAIGRDARRRRIARRRSRRAPARSRRSRRNRVYTDGAFRDAPVYARDDLRPGRRDRRPRGHPRAQRDDGVEPGWRATLTRARSTSCSSASRRRGARTRSAPPPTRCCSRCSTTSSWRSPSRWA